ncbi:loricrin-like [Pyrus ussuriensis x Pyrus communis]|uniref:Loricrin-like n=1 Tax=Pyrus ussuriensis x Pyrus communis TaxID=2448454 RepID=A0A5N5GBT8_9ROSA|nr:loricrin-like [Pyrus ussuriensis x Pyrus communis]
MARTYVGPGGGHAGGVDIMMPDHNSGGLLLLCMILMSLSLVSMVILSCGDGSNEEIRPGVGGGGGGCGGGGGGGC